MNVLNAITDPIVNSKSIGTPISFKFSTLAVLSFVFGRKANTNWLPYMIKHASVAPIWIPPAVSTTVAWKLVKCLRYSIEKWGRSCPFIIMKMGQNRSPSLSNAQFMIQKKTWLN